MYGLGQLEKIHDRGVAQYRNRARQPSALRKDNGAFSVAQRFNERHSKPEQVAKEEMQKRIHPIVRQQIQCFVSARQRSA